MGVGSPLSEVEGLFLPHYLNPPGTQPQPQQAAVLPPGTPCATGGQGKLTRALSPTGVDEIDMMVQGSGAGEEDAMRVSSA